MDAVSLPTRKATKELARALAPLLRGGDLVILSGALGAGKTFFTRALLRALGLPAAERVTSPTFSLVHEHEARLRVAHADLYRVKDASELGELGLYDLRAGGAVVVVEWGEPYVGELGGDALIVRLTVDGGARSATFEGTGERSAELARAIDAVRAAYNPPASC